MAVALVNTTRRAGAARLINIRGSSEQAVRSEKGCRFIKKKGKKKKKKAGTPRGLTPHSRNTPHVFPWEGALFSCGLPWRQCGSAGTKRRLVATNVSLKRVINGCLLITERPLQRWSHTLINEYDMAMADMLSVLMRRLCCAAATWAE